MMVNTFSTTYASAAIVPSPGTVTDKHGGPSAIAIVDEREIRQLSANKPQTGTPRYCALRPLFSDGAGPQKWVVVFYPTPNKDMAVEFRYGVTPQPLSADNPYPIGGRQHAETLLQSCLAVAELREQKEAGAQSARFMASLASSIKLDLATAAPTAPGTWPFEDMPDSLTVTRAYLKRRAGLHMGIGANQGTWNHHQAQQVELAVQTGLRRFYTPIPLPGEKSAWEWSFLFPEGNLTTVTAKGDYDLPEDFAMIDGPMTYEPESNVLYPEVIHVGEHQLRYRRQRTQVSNRSELFAIRVKNPDAGTGTRYELLLWPTPDQEYNIKYRYKINPGSLSDDTAQPLGGQPHMECVIASVLAATDEILERKSQWDARYLQSLAASVSHDRRVNAAGSYGRNVDRSDRPLQFSMPDWHEWDDNLTPINGVSGYA